MGIANIKTYHVLPETHFIPIEGTYQFSEKAGHLNIQRLCYWILDRIGHEVWYKKEITFSTIEVNFDNLIDELLKHEEVVYQFVNNPRGYLVVGRNYSRRIYSRELNHFFQTNFPSNFEPKIHPIEYRFLFKGYPIIFVPWIEGIFILPELK